eukprot:982537-Pleurochrysis_carterae.AAC.1
MMTRSATEISVLSTARSAIRQGGRRVRPSGGGCKLAVMGMTGAQRRRYMAVGLLVLCTLIAARRSLFHGWRRACVVGRGSGGGACLAVDAGGCVHAAIADD